MWGYKPLRRLAAGLRVGAGATETPVAKDQEKLCFACPASYPAAYSSCPKCQLPLVFPCIGKVWRVEGLIGRGGMGAVFLAHHVDDPRKRAAVKVLATIAGEQRADRMDRIARFQREAEAMRRLTHPNIVQLYDFSRERDGSLYLAMEYLQGQSLSKLLKERRCLPGDEAVSLILPVLSAVEAAHKVGVIHRDLKPDNIVLATVSDGKRDVQRIKVVDFGVARLKDDSLTDSGQALGTPVYMAPEQAQGSSVDERVDVYGAGAVLYELLTGHPPFTPPDAPNANLAVLARIMTTDPTPIRERCPDLSTALESVVQGAMCRDREKRYHTVEEFAAALQEALKRPDERLWTPPVEIAALALPSAVAAAVSQPNRSLRNSIPPHLRTSMGPLRRSMGPGASVPSSPMSPMHGGPSGPVSALSRSAANAPAVPLSVSRSGAVPPLGTGSRPPSAPPGSPSAPSRPPVARSAQSFTPVPPGAASEASRPAVAASKSSKPPASRGYRLFIAGLYLVLVGAILLVLAITNCRVRKPTSLLVPASPVAADPAGRALG
jgi:serine/threonine-protein kinase